MSAPTIASWPWGSVTAKRRNRSNSRAKRSRLWAIGPSPSGGPPSTITRVGSPSVWESMTRNASVLRAGPGGPPGAERHEPPLRHALLRGAQGVEGVQVQGIFVVALERHQTLEIEHEIDALVEDRERRER